MSVLTFIMEKIKEKPEHVVKSDMENKTGTERDKQVYYESTIIVIHCSTRVRKTNIKNIIAKIKVFLLHRRFFIVLNYANP